MHHPLAAALATSSALGQISVKCLQQTRVVCYFVSPISAPLWGFAANCPLVAEGTDCLGLFRFSRLFPQNRKGELVDTSPGIREFDGTLL